MSKLNSYYLRAMNEEETETTDGTRKILCVRSQHSRGGSSSSFGGPDTYIAVQVVPPGQSPLKCLNEQVAKKRGITIKYFGEGYSKRSGPKSMLGKAIAAAKYFCDQD